MDPDGPPTRLLPVCQERACPACACQRARIDPLLPLSWEASLAGPPRAVTNSLVGRPCQRHRPKYAIASGREHRRPPARPPQSPPKCPCSGPRSWILAPTSISASFVTTPSERSLPSSSRRGTRHPHSTPPPETHQTHTHTYIHTHLPVANPACVRNRQALRHIIQNTTLPPRTRAEAQLQLTQMHCYTRPTQIRGRCILGGKGRGIFRDFKMSRVCAGCPGRGELLANALGAVQLPHAGSGG